MNGIEKWVIFVTVWTILSLGALFIIPNLHLSIIVFFIMISIPTVMVSSNLYPKFLKEYAIDYTQKRQEKE